MGGSIGGWVGNRVAEITKDPLRTAAAIGTFGTSELGRAAQDRIGGTAKDILNDPGRAALAVGTLGGSELWNAVDNKMFNDPRNKAEDAAAKAADQANKMIDEQKAQMATLEMNKQRDLQRARMRALAMNRGGAASTRTSTLGAPGAYQGGVKTVLGQ